MSSVIRESSSNAAQRSVADRLIPLHERWFRLVHGRLAPLLTTEADIWARWPAARFLSDQFEDWLGHERRLLQSLARYLRPADMRHLEQSTAALASIREELEELGRHEGDGQTIDVARRFFARLELWRIEVEAALAGISCDRLSEEDERLLGHLEMAAERDR